MDIKKIINRFIPKKKMLNEKHIPILCIEASCNKIIENEVKTAIWINNQRAGYLCLKCSEHLLKKRTDQKTFFSLICSRIPKVNQIYTQSAKGKGLAQTLLLIEQLPCSNNTDIIARYLYKINCITDTVTQKQTCQGNANIVLDTNTLINDPDILHKLANNTIHIPKAVITELDGLKNHADKVKASNARKASKFIATAVRISINETRKPTPHILIVKEKPKIIDDMPITADHKIIGTAMALNENLSDVILLTNDENMISIATTHGVETYKPHEWLS